MLTSAFVSPREMTFPSQRNVCASALQETSAAIRNKLTNIVLMVSVPSARHAVYSVIGNVLTRELYHNTRYPEIAIIKKTSGKRHVPVVSKVKQNLT
jgi:hypothetical protein